MVHFHCFDMLNLYVDWDSVHHPSLRRTFKLVALAIDEFEGCNGNIDKYFALHPNLDFLLPMDSDSEDEADDEDIIPLMANYQRRSKVNKRLAKMYRMTQDSKKMKSAARMKRRSQRTTKTVPIQTNDIRNTLEYFNNKHSAPLEIEPIITEKDLDNDFDDSLSATLYGSMDISDDTIEYPPSPSTTCTLSIYDSAIHVCELDEEFQMTPIDVLAARRSLRICLELASLSNLEQTIHGLEWMGDDTQPILPDFTMENIMKLLDDSDCECGDAEYEDSDSESNSWLSI